jgi:hypothetical protein
MSPPHPVLRFLLIWSHSSRRLRGASLPNFKFWLRFSVSLFMLYYFLRMWLSLLFIGGCDLTDLLFGLLFIRIALPSSPSFIPLATSIPSPQPLYLFGSDDFRLWALSLHLASTLIRTDRLVCPALFWGSTMRSPRYLSYSRIQPPHSSFAIYR